MTTPACKDCSDTGTVSFPAQDGPEGDWYTETFDCHAEGCEARKLRGVAP